MQRNKKEIKLKRVLEFRAQATIKAAAKEKMQSFYFQIKDVDLIAKELQYHQPCYNAFTKGYSNTTEGTHVLNVLKTAKLVLSCEGECVLLTLTDCYPFNQLLSNQEEADTKVIAHSIQALTENTSHQVIIRSPSGDTDILVLATSLLYEYRSKVNIDNGSGKNRKLIWFGGLDLEPKRCEALIGLHAFTGNDYISSFFRKGKDQCWKVMEKFQKFENCFAELGNSVELNMDTFSLLEEYVCHLYGIRSKTVDGVRYKMFQKKQEREHKVTDLASLPPCQQVLMYHAQRANVVSYIWKNSINAVIEQPHFDSNGWMSNGEIYWMDNAFPTDVESILDDDESDDDEEEQYDVGSDIESDDESVE